MFLDDNDNDVDDNDVHDNDNNNNNNSFSPFKGRDQFRHESRGEAREANQEAISAIISISIHSTFDHGG